MTEDRLLDWLRRQDPELERLLGDDAAMLPDLGHQAVTVDSQIAGVHFPPDLDPALIARRLLAVNLSDLAAMGAEPRFAFLALMTPPEFDHRRFFRALLEDCRSRGVQLAGGDLARAETVSASLTLIGTSTEGGARWLTRSGARPGNRLWVGGTLGESAAGRWLVAAGARMRGDRVQLPSRFSTPPNVARAARKAVRRHLLPTPQLQLGRWLRVATGKVAAAIDLSDGLARDLPRLARRSGCGAEVHSEKLPRPPHFEDLCKELGQEPEALLLGGGEDYVLLFTLLADLEPPESFGCYEIGTITRGKTLRWIREGRPCPFPRDGWDHFT